MLCVKGKRHEGAIPLGPSEFSFLKERFWLLAQSRILQQMLPVFGGKLCAAEHSLVINFISEHEQWEERFTSLLGQLPSCCCCHASDGTGPKAIWWVVAKPWQRSIPHVMLSECLGLPNKPLLARTLGSWSLYDPMEKLPDIPVLRLDI